MTHCIRDKEPGDEKKKKKVHGKREKKKNKNCGLRKEERRMKKEEEEEEEKKRITCHHMYRTGIETTTRSVRFVCGGTVMRSSALRVAAVGGKTKKKKKYSIHNPRTRRRAAHCRGANELFSCST